MAAGDDTARAEEVAQETLLRLWQAAARFDPEKASVQAWIFAIARNARIDILRKSQRLFRGDNAADPDIDCEPQESSEAQAIARQQAETLKKALEILPDEQSEVVRLSYFSQIPQSMIAEELGVPIGTVKSRLRLGLRKLRTAMDEKS
ncbi:MAG: sigma-70 family RNA polymerase sigma factor [Geminicoccaceae bacterium]